MNPEDIKTFFSSLTLEKVGPALLILVVGLIVVKVLNIVFKKILTKSRVEKSIHSILCSAFKILLNCLLALIVASKLGIDVTSLVAILGVASLAISLAVQGALSNLTGGVMILTTHPFLVGDWVEIANVSGTVKEIGISYTRLMTADQKEIFIPNSEIAASKIINYTKAGSRRVDFTFSASYDSDVEEVKTALLKAAMMPKVQTEPAPFAAVNKYGDNSIEYVLRVWTAAEDYWDVWFGVTEKVKVCFDEAGIEMSYPHLNVHLDAKAAEKPSVSEAPKA